MNKITIWLQELPRFAGAIIGIALTAIGTVMVVNIALKTFVFDFDVPRYFNAEEECRYQPYEERIEGEKAKRLTTEEKTVCIKEKTETATVRYKRDKMENMIDGIAMLAVGIPFWIIFGRRRKNT